MCNSDKKGVMWKHNEKKIKFEETRADFRFFYLYFRCFYLKHQNMTHMFTYKKKKFVLENDQTCFGFQFFLQMTTANACVCHS